ncbi:hypothetical protein [Aliiglaciecola sp. LCG003]|uniref:hypothetical protein n=1 Tax=Aliiglaciecola sp. LCG003 TaxID=3053655 RepID=UPI002572A705|nr:hypothetical protein [Aliiglaciecola sp. LCG003]WJG10302.1 hypothetical protein QR722_04505 [Aliiglaciecola sp. LCG003]
MNKVKCILLSLTALCSTMQLSQAAVVTSGCADANFCTLQELVNGGDISVNDITFTNWQELTNFFFEVDDNGAETNGTLDLSGIFVAGIDAVATGNVGEYTLGLLFSSEVALSLPLVNTDVLEAELELDIDYDVDASNGALVTAAQLDLGGRSLNSPDSFVEVNLDSLTADLNLQVYDEFVDPDPDSVLTESDVFAAALSSFELTSNIQTGTFVPGGVELYDFSVTLTVLADDPPPNPVPAPPSLYLLLLGSAVLFFQRRKFSINQK